MIEAPDMFLWPVYTIGGALITLYNLLLLLYFVIYNWSPETLATRPGQLLKKLCSWSQVLKLKLVLAKKYNVDFSPLVAMFIIAIAGQLILRFLLW